MGIVKNQTKNIIKKPRGRPPKTRIITVPSMDFLRKVEPLDLDGNVSQNWRVFKQNFSYFFTAAELSKKPDEVQAAIFLNTIGPAAVELFNSFNLEENKRKQYKEVVQAFENFCTPKSNEVYASFMFHNRNQAPSEPFDTWLMDLKKLVKTCNFGGIEQENRMLRDRLVLGTSDKTLQKKLLETENLTAEKTVEMARSAEATKRQAENLQIGKFSGNRSMEAYTVSKQRNISNSKDCGSGTSTNNQDKFKLQVCSSRYNRNVQKNVNNSSTLKVNTGSYIKKCKYCLQDHMKGRCPAYGKKCKKCGKENHFASACMKRAINEVTDMKVGHNNEVLFVDTIKQKNASDSKEVWLEKIKINNQIVTFKLDTGADVNVLPSQFISKMSGVRCIKKPIILESYSGYDIRVKGAVKLKCEVNGRVTEQEFIVVENGSIPLLGLSSCVELGLIKRINILGKGIPTETKEEFVAKYKEVFEGLGEFPEPYRLVLKKDVTPVAKPARRVPLALLNPLKIELDELCKREIIEKSLEPSEWTCNLVIVEKKNKKLRLCLDPKYLNQAIISDPHIIPTFDELSTKLVGMKYFTVLDLKEGYWQVKLDSDSCKLCTFSTPFGSFRFKRLPFGIKSAPEAFQKLNEHNFADLKGVVVYIDDILVGGKTVQEHDRNLERVMTRAKERNVKFNQEKIQFRLNKVQYLGHIISSEGIEIDPDRMQAIKELTAPKDKKQLQSILGMINYLRPFIPDLSEISHPLRELLKTQTVFQWGPKQDTCLAEIKRRVMAAPALQPFDFNKDIVIQSDASKFGLGCCLMQDSKPVSFASRSMTPAEINYGQIDKEFLAIVFACTKYHKLIYGRPVTVVTDHKPLLGIMNKEIGQISAPRLQRMKLRLMKYDLTIKYTPGKELIIPDLLSRNFPIKDNEPEIKDLSEVVHSINVSDEKKLIFKKETEKDSVLCELMKVIQNGWPENKTKLPDKIKFFWRFRHNIYVEDGLIFLDDRIVIPTSLQPEILRRLHESHLGIVKTKQRARSLVYWPAINEEIENLISKCATCQKFRHSNANEPLMPHEIPEFPYFKLGMDIMETGGKSFLVIADYFSKYLDIVELSKKTGDAVIKKLKNVFSTHGIPRIIVADNMPFNSYAFRKFASELDIEINTSSPQYPRSNGLAEKFVQIAKSIIQKANDSNVEFWKALLEYRNTPIKGSRVSPTELLFGRKCRTLVPAKLDLFRKRKFNEMKLILEKNSFVNKTYYDRNTRPRPNFSIGSDVWVLEGKVWKKAKITDRDNAPRSFWIKLENGTVVRRNSKFLRNRRN